MPSSSTQDDAQTAPNINKMHAKLEYDKTRTWEANQSKIFGTNTKRLSHTHTANNSHSEKIYAIQSHAIRNPAIAKHKQNARKTVIWQNKMGEMSQRIKFDTNTKSHITHTTQTIKNQKKSLPYKCTHYDTLTPPNKNNKHARRKYDKTKKGEISQRRINDTDTKSHITHTTQT